MNEIISNQARYNSNNAETGNFNKKELRNIIENFLNISTANRTAFEQLIRTNARLEE